ncbi:hypothetical protein DFAR_850023 [Desulfarculales bacterium]
MALIFLQIGILLSAISALLKKKPRWFLGMAVNAVGMVYFFILFAIMSGIGVVPVS